MAQSECECVKWHSPKPTRLFDANGVKVCNVTADAVDQLLAKALKRGRIAKVDQRGFTAFQRDLATAMYNAGVFSATPLGEVAAEDESSEEGEVAEPVEA